MKASGAGPAAGELSRHRSSYSSGSGGDCVEVAAADTAVLVRDSKRPG